jgi:hypothetical protein
MKRKRAMNLPYSRRAMLGLRGGETHWRRFLAAIPTPLHPVARRAFRRKPPCLLCGGTMYTLGAFVPREPGLWGSPPGQACGAVYSLCTDCATREDKAERAEAVLWELRER